MTAILIVSGMILLLIGLLGTIYPVFPGLVAMFIGAWLLGYAGNYQIIGSGTLISLAVLTCIGIFIDYLAGVLGAKFSGASKIALWGALAGSLIGVFFGIPGMLAGPLLGAAIGELWAKKDLFQAGKVGIGTFIGLIFGVAAKLGCAIAILLVLAVQGILSLF